MRAAQVLFPMQDLLAASLDAHFTPVYVGLIVDLCLSEQQFHLKTPLASLARNPEKLLFHHCVACCAFGVSFHWSLLD